MDQNRVENQVDEGTLQIHLTNASTGIPVKGARITISYTGGPQQVLEEVDTDDSGNTEKITLDAPPLEYSMEPGENQPYAEYTIKVQATGYRDITVSAINILSGEDATQEVVMEAQDAPGDPIDTIVIDAHTLYGEYPPKIPESEIKTVEETGEIVLSRVVIPEYVVVHDGAPGDSTAANYYVRYRDYIKNVASSECDLAGCHNPCQCAGYYVIYFKPGLYGMVPGQRVCVYHHIFHGIRSQIYLRKKFLPEYFTGSG